MRMPLRCGTARGGTRGQAGVSAARRSRVAHCAAGARQCNTNRRINRWPSLAWAEKMAFMTPMYWDGASGAAARHSSRAGCCRRAGSSPPLEPPSSAPWAAAARRCRLCTKHSTRLSALLSWQAPPWLLRLPPLPSAAPAAAASAATRCSPARMAAEGGQGSGALVGPAAGVGPRAGRGVQLGEAKASWQPAAPAVNTASWLPSFSSVKALRKVTSCSLGRRQGGGVWE